MREIIFRGKSEYDGEWIHGGALHQTDNYGDEVDRWFIIDGTETNDYDIGEPIRVIPETIGQYTGLTDKNGKKIFEGDIVKCTDTNNSYDFTAVVLFGNPNGEYNWGFQLKRIGGEIANTDILLWAEVEETGAFIEVVGNIHDNP